MPDCELLTMCPYFNDDTYGMPEIFKEQYCRGEYRWCGRYMAFKAEERDMPKQETIFRISGYNRGVACPFLATVCPGGYCHQCPIYLDWQKRGEVAVICAWCGTVIDRYKNPTAGRAVESHGICPECKQEYFPKTLEEKNQAVKR